MLPIVILRSFGMRVATPMNSFPAGVIWTDLVLLSKSLVPRTSSRCFIVLVSVRRSLGIRIKVSRTPGGLRSKPKPLGQDTCIVVRGVGLTGEEIDALILEGVAIDPDNGK